MVTDMQDLIQKIFEKQNPQDGSVPQWAINLCLEFGKQVCDLQIEKCKEEAYIIPENLMGVPEVIIKTKNICNI
jgi:hypothetical protein